MNQEIHQVILFLIDQTNKTAKRYSQREFDKMKLGITVDQWVLLKIIEENNGLSQKELADKSIKDAASITRILDLLQKRKLIKRVQIPENRRQYKIEVSAEGKQFINNNMGMITKHRAKSLEGFSKDEVEQLKAMLLKIQKNMG